MRERKGFKLLLIIILSMTMAAPAQAGRFFVGGGIGTLGVGADLGYQFTNWFKMRLNVNYLPFDYDYAYDGIDYDAEFRNFTAGLLLDIHPFMGNFRITAGVYYRDLEVNLDATPRGGAQIGGRWYSASEIGKIEAKATWDKFAPYAGIGWGLGSGTDTDFSLDFNLGVMALRGIDIDYKLTGTAEGSVGSYQQDIDREAQKIKDDISDWNIYPVVSLFFTFRF